jgi:hypothetical protein
MPLDTVLERRVTMRHVQLLVLTRRCPLRRRLILLPVGDDGGVLSEVTLTVVVSILFGCGNGGRVSGGGRRRRAVLEGAHVAQQARVVAERGIAAVARTRKRPGLVVHGLNVHLQVALAVEPGEAPRAAERLGLASAHQLSRL